VRSVESTALRVLRALEEEGEKNRASAVTVKVANDVAIYTLNQKRRELARIETEYGMEVSFEPKEGLMAGHFEMDRTRTRDPEDRPRNHAVSIEAGFVPSEEPEDDIPVEDEEDEVEASDGVTPETDTETREPAAQSREGENGSRRKRRRRGGRGRNRGPRPEGADTEQRPAEVSAVGDMPVSAEDSEGEAGDDVREPHGAEPHGNGQHTGPAAPAGENGRRKRRRRGRRGGRNRDQEGQHAPASGVEADRFGTPDEIDTTPTDAIHAPGAPSAPVWSLQDDIPDTTPKDDAARPAKKGWWQRAFSGDK
jgi:ribonuclease E